MDSVPYRFLESVAFLFKYGTLHQFSELSRIGAVATEMLEKDACRTFIVRNGELFHEYFWYLTKNGEKVRCEGERRSRSIVMKIYAGSQVYQADSLLLRRIQACSQRNHVVVHLNSDNLGEEILAFLDTTSVSVIHVTIQSTLKMMPILKKVVRKNTLNFIELRGNVNYHTGFGNLLKELWKQEQFAYAVFPVLSITYFKALLRSWHHNSAKTTGKRIKFSSLSDTIDLGKWGFEEATQDELDDLKRCSPLVFCTFVEGLQRALITRNQSGARMFWLSQGSVNMLVF